MRKFFIALAAIAAFVGCSKEDKQPHIDTKANFALNASIVVDDTRVSVGGEKFTEVSWVKGDKIRVESLGGLNTELEATASGRENIRFVGTEPTVADKDTYYAVYPSSNISNESVTFYCNNQSGKDVACLVAKAEEVTSANLDMMFKPVNALLHVSVNGVESLAKAEFKSYTDKAFAATFTYDYTNDQVEYSGSTTAYEVENPNVEGFFFSLPADLDMSEGYVVTLTDGSGNVCSKAYNGKIFERATTTRVEIDFTMPTVTLGEPMTSYSYYAKGDATTANSCANNVVYFPTSSKYHNLQNKMIAEAGFIVDGTTYTAMLDTATKSFSIESATVSSWGAKSVEAYVKTKDGRTIKSAPATVHITGLPYHADWRSADYGDWKYVNISDGGAYLQVTNRALGCIISPEFKLPANITVTSAIAASTNATATGGYTTSYAYVGTRDASAKESGARAALGYVSDFGGAIPDTPLQKHNDNLTLTTNNPCVVMTAKDFALFCNTYIYQAKVEYAQ